MSQSPEITELAKALSKAQGEMKNPETNRTASFMTKAGVKITYNYADLPSTITCVRSVLAANGLSHTSMIEAGPQDQVVVMRLMHLSGQWIESRLALPAATDPKSMAANLTYFRRYLLNGLLGISGDDDIDHDSETGPKIDSRPSDAPLADPATPVSSQSPPHASKPAYENCQLCGTQLKYTAKKKAWYCPNMGDKTKGFHTYLKDEDDVP